MNQAAAEQYYDVVVLGGGPVGQTAALTARAGGLSVALVERELVGGECSYWGCVPSKALLRPVLAVADARRVDGARQAVTGAIDPFGVFSRRDRYVTHWHDEEQTAAVTAAGVDVVRGHGRLDGARRVTITDADDRQHVLTARHAVAICTGSRAALPTIPGVAETDPWTNRHATDSSSVPASLIVVGGGGVGVEMATAWQGLGAKVTILARSATLLPRMEPFVGEYVARGLTEAGIDVQTGVEVTELTRRAPAEPVTVTLSTGDQLLAEQVLFATGRTPNTDDIGVQTVHLTPGGWLDVDDTCRVQGIDGAWLYAMGDANHRALLTHQGKYQARIAANAIVAAARGDALDTAPWGAHVATADTHAVPQAFFTDPEAGSVGLTLDEAHQRGLQVRAVDVDMGATVAGANLYADGYTGRARLVVHTGTGHVLGAAFVGLGVAELLHAATIAVAGQVPIHRLWHAVPCFPTVNEVWLRLLEAYRDEEHRYN